MVTNIEYNRFERREKWTYAEMLLESGHRSIVAWNFMFSICFLSMSLSIAAKIERSSFDAKYGGLSRRLYTADIYFDSEGGRGRGRSRDLCSEARYVLSVTCVRSRTNRCSLVILACRVQIERDTERWVRTAPARQPKCGRPYIYFRPKLRILRKIGRNVWLEPIMLLIWFVSVSVPWNAWVAWVCTLFFCCVSPSPPPTSPLLLIINH